MKKNYLYLLPLIALLTLFTSCIRDESESTQCDIVAVDSAWLSTLPDGLVLGTPIIQQGHPAKVTFLIKERMDTLKQLAPRFHVSPGATLYYRQGGTLVPYDGTTTYDFTQPQTFSVQAENAQFVKDYQIEFNIPLPLNTCGFEHFGYAGKKKIQYMVLYQMQQGGTLSPDIWSSGNPGYDLTGLAKSPEDFPTSFRTEPNGNHYACLITRDNGRFGMMTRPRMPIAGGNLFIGEFLLAKATRQPREATRFGLQIAQGKPLRLEGRYTYHPGPTFTDENKNEVSNERDSADIYAVLYEVDPKDFQPLNGDNVLTSDRIVMKARLENPGEPHQWTKFSIPFRLMPGKTFSEERLRRDGYAYTIVLASSRHADFFRGAIGSTLCVDDLTTIWQRP